MEINLKNKMNLNLAVGKSVEEYEIYLFQVQPDGMICVFCVNELPGFKWCEDGSQMSIKPYRLVTMTGNNNIDLRLKN